MGKIENLDQREKEEVLRFLLHHMSMETRGKLMAALPVPYAMMFPSVTSQTLHNHVRNEIDRRERERITFP